MGDRALIADAVRRHSITGAILFAAHAYVGESTSEPAKYYRNNLTQSIEFLDALRAIQSEYQDWLDNLPENLASGNKAEQLQAIVDIDLSELEGVNFPSGRG